MTEEAAQPADPGAAQPGGPPPTATPPAGAAAPPPVAAPPPAGDAGGTPPPGAGPGPGPQPSFGGAGFTSRYGLVRPRDGRYLAGVCAAIGRATNTDPVLWRVLLAVLGFFGGIGILVYVTAWLIIPGEGDSASPVESMLGRGRSSMSPVTVIVLSILVAISFGYIVTDAFRAVLLGATILIGGALLLNRDNRAAQGAPAGPVPPVPPTAPPGPVPPVGHPVPVAYPAPPTVAVAPGAGPVPAPPATVAQPAWSAPATPPTADLPAWPPAAPAPPARPPVGTPTVGWPPAPPTSGWPAATSGAPGPGHPVSPPRPPGYRPPFAPHGPYAGQTVVPPAPRKPPKPPKRPKERSPLGAVTFSLIFLALGVVAVVDLLDVYDIGASAYFAATLATIGLGLLVGTWFGRARWLIALGVVAAAALGVATVAESYDRIRGVDGNVTWAPTDHRDLALRYENSFGDTVLDLRAVDFDKKNTEITVSVNFGECTVVVPPNVDVTTVADVNAGDAVVFGKHSGGLAGELRETTDLGPDGPGGGTLRLYIHINAGNLEVTR
ncbi:PspC domain-containing protein [Micromonospora sp. DSM 115977]|uniref:PspC domain-containing protein n=1 Tax=Micromonospora reichwaldensis TaxID=3075516 RepID=A0ABU2WRD4_9ACTN|nr:PspC domain-containing protein [Micromonospora sp. DSM 115977]MDT0528468.1 PspC domain-containing protein [Micromonospora sp. DSM 115977]